MQLEYDLDSIVKLFKLGCKRKFLNYWCPQQQTLQSFRTDSWQNDCRKLVSLVKVNPPVIKNYRRW